MLFGEFEADKKECNRLKIEPAADREIRLRQESKRIVTVEECGRIIGKIILPVEGDIFGPWRGAVYLTRD